MTFADGHARMIEGFAHERKLEDATLQRKTIVGDEDGHWLSRQVEELHHGNGVIRSDVARSYHFLGDDEEAVLNGPGPETVIDMPGGSIIRQIDGDDFDSWVFRVDNGLQGEAREYIDLAYREITPSAHMLYLKLYHRSHASSSQ